MYRKFLRDVVGFGVHEKAMERVYLSPMRLAVILVAGGDSISINRKFTIVQPAKEEMRWIE